MAEQEPATNPRDETSSQSSPSLIAKLMVKIGAGETGRSLATGAVGSFVMKSGASVATFLLTILLTNTLDADGYGALAYARSWVYLLTIPALLGFDRLMLREIPFLEQKKEWAQLRGLIRFSHVIVISLSLLIAGGGAWIAWRAQQSPSPNVQLLTSVLVVAMLLLPAFSFLRLRQNILLAKKKYITSQVGELLILPWGTLLILAGIALLRTDILTAEIALFAYLIASIIGIVYLLVASRGQFAPELKQTAPAYDAKRWLAVSFPMLLVAGMQVMNQRVDILMVGSLMGAEEAGIYDVANRGVMIIMLIFFAINQPLAPVIAQLHAEKRTERLQNILVRAARISLLAALPIGLLLIIFATPFLRLFGEEFPAGRIPMIIMTVGYVITMSFGSVSSALTMTGHERAAAFGIGVSVVLNITLNLLLIPHYGMVGAAWALAIGQISAMILMSVLVKRKLGINTTATGRTL
jgi:O-antigen/teichoic acid export membrane protein